MPLGNPRTPRSSRKALPSAPAERTPRSTKKASPSPRRAPPTSARKASRTPSRTKKSPGSSSKAKGVKSSPVSSVTKRSTDNPNKENIIAKAAAAKNLFNGRDAERKPSAKQGTKRPPRAVEQPSSPGAGAASGHWTDEELLRLHRAVRVTSPLTANYWRDIAAAVGGDKTPQMCHDRFSNHAERPRGRERGDAAADASPAAAAAAAADAVAAVSAATLGGAGTLRRKRNLRQLYNQREAGYGGDDAFAGSPMKKYRGVALHPNSTVAPGMPASADQPVRAASVDKEEKEDEEDKDDDDSDGLFEGLPGAQCPREPVTPGKTTHDDDDPTSPEFLRPVDRSTYDAYVARGRARAGALVRQKARTTAVHPRNVDPAPDPDRARSLAKVTRVLERTLQASASVSEDGDGDSYDGSDEDRDEDSGDLR